MLAEDFEHPIDTAELKKFVTKTLKYGNKGKGYSVSKRTLLKAIDDIETSPLLELTDVNSMLDKTFKSPLSDDKDPSTLELALRELLPGEPEENLIRLEESEANGRNVLESPFFEKCSFSWVYSVVGSRQYTMLTQDPITNKIDLPT